LKVDAQEQALKLKGVLHDLYNEDKITVVKEGESHFVTLKSHWIAEKGCATRLSEICKAKSLLSVDIDAMYTVLRTKSNLHEDQQKGIIAALQNKISIITGGPGTGKTTLIKELLRLLTLQKVSFCLAAPTGRAA